MSLQKKIDEWFSLLQEMGCIVCLNDLNVISPPDMHHIHKNGKKVDDLHTIPLCPTHHRFGINTAQAVSRHPWKAEFERRYGSEWELYAQVQQLADQIRKRRRGY
jgi:Recombination enhancement, RecA-dependent nuclease